MVAVFTHQGQAVETGHDQVLQDDRGFDQYGLGNRLVRVGTEVKVDVLFLGQAAAHRLADHGLVIDQQDHGGIFIGTGKAIDG
ncbi:hypothetical protein D9M73_280410 [compost metagenome]